MKIEDFDQIVIKGNMADHLCNELRSALANVVRRQFRPVSEVEVMTAVGLLVASAAAPTSAPDVAIRGAKIAAGAALPVYVEAIRRSDLARATPAGEA